MYISILYKYYYKLYLHVIIHIDYILRMIYYDDCENNSRKSFWIEQRYHLIIILNALNVIVGLSAKESSVKFPVSIYRSRTLESVKRHERFIFNYFSELCCRELYREAIKESMCMVNMLFSTCVAFDGRSLGSWCTLIRKCFSLLWNCMCTVRLSLSRTHSTHVRIYVCMIPRTHTLPAINNANGFRQRCQGIMHKHTVA